MNIKKRIDENVINPYTIMVAEINDLLDSTGSVLSACLFHKYCEKWIGLAKYSSTFFKNDPDAMKFFETLNVTDIQRNLLLLKMRLTNMRMKDCKISACNTFCEECVLRSFSDEQCIKFFEDIK